MCGQKVSRGSVDSSGVVADKMCSLALLEMKTLLRQVYVRFKTTLPPEMELDMEVDDQVVASRPKKFKALLRFQEIPL